MNEFAHVMENTFICNAGLLCIGNDPSTTFMRNNFYGKEYTSLDSVDKNCKYLYLCGNMNNVKTLPNIKIFIISEFSSNYEKFMECTNVVEISMGMVPINIHNVAIQIPKQFEGDVFDKVVSEHRFQELTEFNKPTSAYRKGLYMTNVKKTPDGKEFNLLRCSTNLRGPTDNFKSQDLEILNVLREYANMFFTKKVDLNHVLAQVYYNTVRDGKERKARISEHSDKTKDMPKDGLMAFCTFYSQINGSKTADNPFDCRYKKTSVLTKLRFRIKKEFSESGLEKKFDVSLYPGSILLMPLSTNRIYTHEIVPATLPNDKLPTRMGYVVRCSNRKAIHSNGETFIINGTSRVKLDTPDPDGIEKLKDLYRKENSTADFIDYDEHTFNFSFNDGDYVEPNI